MCLLHAVVAGDQDGCAHAESHAEDLEDEDIGIGQGSGRKSVLRIVAEHDVVEHADTDGHKRLQSDREPKDEDFLIKVRIFSIQFHGRFSSDTSPLTG